MNGSHERSVVDDMMLFLFYFVRMTTYFLGAVEALLCRNHFTKLSKIGTKKLLILVFQHIWFSHLDFPSRSFLYSRGPADSISSFNRISSELILRGYFFSGLNHFPRYVCNILHIILCINVREHNQIRCTPYLYPSFIIWHLTALLNSFSNLNA